MYFNNGEWDGDEMNKRNFTNWTGVARTDYIDADNWAALPGPVHLVAVTPAGDVYTEFVDHVNKFHAVPYFVPGPVGISHVGRLIVHYVDNFRDGGEAFNPIADHMLSRLGYHAEPGYWHGPVVLSMDLDPATGYVPPFPIEILASLEELAHAAYTR